MYGLAYMNVQIYYMPESLSFYYDLDSVKEPEPEPEPPDLYHFATIRTGAGNVILHLGSGSFSCSGTKGLKYAFYILFLKGIRLGEQVSSSKLKSTCFHSASMEI
jgi:hypothetical protein